MYPQVVINYSKKSVVGLNFDYLVSFKNSNLDLKKIKFSTLYLGIQFTWLFSVCNL